MPGGKAPGFFASMLFSVALLALLVPAARADYPQIRLNTDDSHQLQNEQQIRVHPLDAGNVVAAWRDFRLGYRQVGVGASFDGGLTWTDHLIGGVLPWDSDPVLVTDREGTFYLVVINYVDGGANQISVHRSPDGGASWEGPFQAVQSNGATFEDKEWIAADRTGGPRDGNLYISWSRFYEMRIHCVASSDRGETWTSPVPVSDAGVAAQWPVPIVLRNGNLLVAWCVYSNPRIAFDISTNGGATWGVDRTLTTTTTQPQEDINGAITVFPYPSLAMDETDGPRAGTVYCVYADRAIPANGMDVWCRRSTDDGQTWSDRVRINDDAPGLLRDQFHPWVTCDEQGALIATWYDRRDDPANYLWHIYLSRSTDGGLTWETNLRITTVPSSPGDAANGAGVPSWMPAGEAGLPDPRPGLPLAGTRAGLIGEYSGVAVGAGVIHPVWTDTRNGDQDTYASVLRAPASVAGGGAAIAAAPRLDVLPNPSAVGSEARFHMSLPAGAVSILSILDVSGREVRRLRATGAGEGTILSWDCLLYTSPSPRDSAVYLVC
ncbi:MAG: sialidase family protein, partial [Candidatus Eisenbacteria bacterium]|nr:sialidase family protein [Candidatus Eisenbacteria bacterium]